MIGVEFTVDFSVKKWKSILLSPGRETKRLQIYSQLENPVSELYSVRCDSLTEY